MLRTFALKHQRLEALEIRGLKKMTPAAWNALAQQPLKTLKTGKNIKIELFQSVMLI